MKFGASQNFHFNQHLAEKQKKAQKGIQFFGHPTSTMSERKMGPLLGGTLVLMVLVLN